MSRTVLRASEIGSYLYCARAWWYRRQELPSANIEEMARGDQAHGRHGRRLRLVGRARGLAALLIGLALVLLAWQVLS